MHQFFRKQQFFFPSRSVFFAGEYAAQEAKVATEYETLKKTQEESLLTADASKTVDQLADDSAQKVETGLADYQTKVFAEIDKLRPQQPEAGQDPEKAAIEAKVNACKELLKKQKETFKEVAQYGVDKAALQAQCKNTLSDTFAVTDANLMATLTELGLLKAFKEKALTNPSVMADRAKMGLEEKIPKIEQKIKDCLTQNAKSLEKRASDQPSTLSTLEGLKAEKARLQGFSANKDLAPFADLAGEVALIDAGITECTKNLGQLDKETLANLEMAMKNDTSPNKGWQAGAKEKFAMVVAKGDVDASKASALEQWGKITDTAVQADLRTKYDARWAAALETVKTADGTKDFTAAKAKYSEAKAVFDEIGAAYKEAAVKQAEAAEKKAAQDKADKAKEAATKTYDLILGDWKVENAEGSANWQNGPAKAANEAAIAHWGAADAAYAAGNYETAATEYKAAQVEYNKLALESNPDMKAANNAKAEAYFFWEGLPAGWKVNDAAGSNGWENEAAKAANIAADGYYKAGEFAYNEGNFKIAEEQFKLAKAEYAKIEAEAAKDGNPDAIARRLERSKTDLSGKVQGALDGINIDGKSDADQFTTVFSALKSSLDPVKYEGIAAFSVYGHDQQGHVWEVQWNGGSMQIYKLDKAGLQKVAEEQSKVNEGSDAEKAAKSAVRAKLVSGVSHGEGDCAGTFNFDKMFTAIKNFSNDVPEIKAEGLSPFSVYAPDQWGNTWEVKVENGSAVVFKVAKPSMMEQGLRAPVKQEAPAPAVPPSPDVVAAVPPVVDTGASDVAPVAPENAELTETQIVTQLDAALAQSNGAIMPLTIAGVSVTVLRETVDNKVIDRYSMNDGAAEESTSAAFAAKILEASKKQKEAPAVQPGA